MESEIWTQYCVVENSTCFSFMRSWWRMERVIATKEENLHVCIYHFNELLFIQVIRWVFTIIAVIVIKMWYSYYTCTVCAEWSNDKLTSVCHFSFGIRYDSEGWLSNIYGSFLWGEFFCHNSPAHIFSLNPPIFLLYFSCWTAVLLTAHWWQ